MRNALFIPHTMLDRLADAERIDLDGDELLVIPEGCRYRVVEAVHILAEVITGEDPQQLCGRVYPRQHLTDEIGGDLLGDSMLIEDSAFDVITGLACLPVGNLPDTMLIEEERLFESLQALEK